MLGLAGADGIRATELLEALPSAERGAVRARIVDERSYGEIAAELRCSELVVRKRVSRGLARMREQFKET
jgi:RNA polymerase sigma-70 factor (ECF subfamily)